MSADTKYDYIIYIGRFQPSTLAHLQIMKRAAKEARLGVIVLAGSANQPRTWKNPWTWQEREQMIYAGLSLNSHIKVIVRGLRDYPTDPQWVRAVQQHVEEAIGNMGEYDPSKVAIIGHNKDDSSYYLEMFPQWDQIHVENIESINATDVREALWTSEDEDDFDLKIGRNLPSGLHDWIRAWMLTDAYEQMVREYKFAMHYKETHGWKEPHPYDPIFVTVDAVVVQAGHILLVRRRAEPGRGLWALPGGHIENDRAVDAVIRELRQETKLKVPEAVLRGSIKAKEPFDAPNRSLRGRTITHAFYFDLAPGPLPKVKGADDADKAKWVPLSTFAKMEPQLFEDHFAIANHFLGTN